MGAKQFSMMEGCSVCLGESVQSDGIKLETGTVQVGPGTAYKNYPDAGYFEIQNSSKGYEVVAVKITHSSKKAWKTYKKPHGGLQVKSKHDHGFPYCSKMTILRAGQSLHGFFKPSQDYLTIVVAYGRRTGDEHALHEVDGILCTQQQAESIVPMQNQVPLTWDRQMTYKVESLGKNCLVQYKGQGAVELLNKKLLTQLFQMRQNTASGISLDSNATIMERLSMAM
mmetsp:Transcript_31056/g.41043  ORF Transcript_31056/g.41043 Transcript_31056/m.41043 type:complete len:226 (+) Transcript_31056:95-772(+)